MLLGGRYRLISAPLSTGSFGSVFMAEDERIPRRVAVKILHPQHAENPTVRARFKRELDAASRVSHENVVTVFDSGEDKNLGLYYVMELVRGTSLKDYLNGEPLPWTFTCRVAIQLTRAMHAIHSAGIVHRDLKPQNIMLVERSSLDELVKVLDFGIASLKTVDEEKRDVELTGARMVLGTPPYMSPEQTYMKSDRERLGLEVDARSDIYAMGVIFYEMAAGRRPFSGDAHDIVVAHRLTKPMPLERMVGVQVPREFADLVMRCLAKDPKERPPSAKEVLQALRDLELKPILKWDPDARSSDPQDTATLGEAPALPADISAPALAIDTKPRLELAPPTRSRALWAPLAVVGAAALAVVIALSMGRPEPVTSGTSDVESRRHTGVDLAGPPRAAAATAPAPTAGPSVTAPTIAPAATAAGATASAVDTTHGAVPAPVAPTPADTAGAAGAASQEAGARDEPAHLPKVVRFMLTTQPPGVEVFVGGKREGETPMNLPFRAEEERKVEIVLKKEKFEDKVVTLAIGPELSGKVIVLNEALEKSKRPLTGKPDPFKDL